MRSATIAALMIFILNAGFISSQEQAGVSEKTIPSDIGPFNTEWCSRNSLPKSSLVKEICFGWVEVGQTDSIRALTFKFDDSRTELYIETGFDEIDNSRFISHILGPIPASPNLSTQVEEGEASVSISQDGEVNAVHVRSPRLGYAIAFRKN